MKKIFNLVFIALLVALPLRAQDLTVKPEPLEAKEFTFPEFTVKTLTNGLKVFVIEDHEQPTVAFRLLIPGGSSIEAKPETASIMAEMLTKGANGMSALEIAEKLDGVGASISASAGADYTSVNASSIKKHMDLLLDVFADVVLRPDFPDEEYQKLMPQIIASIKEQKSSSSSMAAALTRKALYGDGHPYATRATEESVKDINLDDVMMYYSRHFTPNKATIAVVGDVEPNDIINKLEKAFSDWKRAPREREIRVPKAYPMAKGVYFIERPGSVQSTVMVSTLAVPYNDPDYEKLKLASQVMGAGFAGRLFRTLRETHSYTYTPYGYVTSAKNINRFVAGADVRNSVTDSAITVIKEQLKLLATKAPDNDEMDLIKNYSVGHYLMSFESTDFIASLIQDADFNDKPIKMVKSYPERMMKITGFDVKNVAAKYMNPENAYIVVVGDPSVKEKLEQFGPVFVYNTDIQPAGRLKDVRMMAPEIIHKYTEAIGGHEKINNIQTLIQEGSAKMSVQGQQLNGTYKVVKKAPNMEYNYMDMTMFRQEQWVSAEKGWSKDPTGLHELKPEDFIKAQQEAVMFPVVKMLEMGYNPNVLGSDGEFIIVEAMSPQGTQQKYYFDQDNFLLMKQETTENTPQGPVAVITKYEDYKEVDGVKLPATTSIETSNFSLILTGDYQVNAEVDDAIFAPELKEGK